MLQEEKIRIDVEESESNITAIQGMKSERHFSPVIFHGASATVDMGALTVYK